MSAKPGLQVVIYQKSESLPAQLAAALHARGLPSQVVVELSELESVLKNIGQEAIILADLGEDEDACFAEIKSLVERELLRRFPLVVVGKEVDGYEGVLGRHFQIATTISLPCTSAEILEAVNFIVRRIERARPATSVTPAPAPSSAAPESAERAKERLEHALYRQLQSIPEIVFAQLTQLNLLQRSLGGAAYTARLAKEQHAELGIGALREDYARLATEVSEQSDKWGRGHLARCVFLTHRLLLPLSPTPETLQQALAAASVYALSFARSDRSLLRQDYIAQRAIMVRKDLCSKVKDSAMKLAVEHQMPEIGKIIALMGRQIGHEEGVSDDPTSVVASAIVAADLADRICFASGHWSPRAAYTLLRRLKLGKLKEIHPAIVAALLKLLSEAIAANPSITVLPKGAAKNTALRERATEIREQSVGLHELKVPIASLMPGMRLTRPVFTYDGKQILSEDLLLDQDLIWRIWQLAALRPLNGPLVILNEASAH